MNGVLVEVLIISLSRIFHRLVSKFSEYDVSVCIILKKEEEFWKNGKNLANIFRGLLVSPTVVT